MVYAVKRGTKFQDSHTQKFGLVVSDCDPDTNQVVSVSCRFCIVFGKENKFGAKRSRGARMKLFKSPVRIENYLTHLKNVHTTTLHAYGSSRNLPVSHLINKDIIEVIIGDMLFHSDDVDDFTHARAMQAFQSTLDESEEDVNAAVVQGIHGLRNDALRDAMT
eukprot:IDg3508t1